MHGQINGWKDKINEYYIMNEWMDVQMNEQRMDGWMNGWIVGPGDTVRPEMQMLSAANF